MTGDAENIIGGFLGRYGADVLEALLRDHATGGNIVWGTPEREALGAGYGAADQIDPEAIARGGAGAIVPRAAKARESRSRRTRARAEVFTPLALVRRMNDLVESDARGGWSDRVRATRLEVTCGEGPFLCTRYDAATGGAVAIADRTGLLDRKLRLVSQNCSTRSAWMDRALEALGSVYGYELQGDSLLIARANAVETLAEHLLDRWGDSLGTDEALEAARVASWNLWQMDGFTCSPPSLDGEGEVAGCAPRTCRILDPASGTPRELADPGDGEPLFDAAVGNPPYQATSTGDQRTYRRPIYDRFIDLTHRMARRSVLVTPARFLFDAGSTPKAWNRRMLSDPHLSVELFEPDARKIFPDCEIKGGVAVTLRDRDRAIGPVGTFTPFPELTSIVRKVESDPSFEPLSSIVFSRTVYRLTAELHRAYPDAAGKLSAGHACDMATNIFERLPEVFSAKRPGPDGDYIQILGRTPSGRELRWIRRAFVNDVANLDSYKLLIPKASGRGAFGEVLAEPVVAGPGVGSTESFVGMGRFGTRAEAEHALAYVRCRFTRALLGAAKVTQDLTPASWRHVPMQDFTDASDINWNRPVAEIDRQLFDKYGLDADEVAFVESHVKGVT